MLAGYNTYPALVSEEQMIISWKTHCQDKRSKRLTSSPQFYRQSSVSSFTKVSEMNVDNTAEWIRNLGKINRWPEADAYAQSFRNNNISGYLLDKLKIGSLKSELGITKYGHRLEIMAAINELYSSVSREGDKEGIRRDTVSSTTASTPGVDPHLGTKGRSHSVLINEMSHPVWTAARLCKGKSAGAVENNNESSWSPLCSNMLCLSKHAQEVRKWVNPSNKSFSTRKWSNDPLTYLGSTMNDHTLAERSKGRSKRARPGNHIAYKALHTVTIQKGKSFSSCIVGYLVEKSIVLINQIKGRRGRIVLRTPNGELLVIGWVPLFTSKGQQLLAKYNKKGGVEVQNSDATIEWKIKSPLEDLNQCVLSGSESIGVHVETLNNQTCLNTHPMETNSDKNVEIKQTTGGSDA